MNLFDLAEGIVKIHSAAQRGSLEGQAARAKPTSLSVSKRDGSITLGLTGTSSKPRKLEVFIDPKSGVYCDEQPLPRDVVKAILGSLQNTAPGAKLSRANLTLATTALEALLGSRYSTFTEATRVAKREGELVTGTDGARLLKRDGVYFAVTTEAWSSPLAWRALSEGETETLKERLGSKF